MRYPLWYSIFPNASLVRMRPSLSTIMLGLCDILLPNRSYWRYSAAFATMESINNNTLISTSYSQCHLFFLTLFFAAKHGQEKELVSKQKTGLNLLPDADAFGADDILSGWDAYNLRKVKLQAHLNLRAVLFVSALTSFAFRLNPLRKDSQINHSLNVLGFLRQPSLPCFTH